jgi:hypothetical protein
VCVCVCVFVWQVRVCEWRGEFNRVVLVVQLGLIFHFILNPEQRRVFQLVINKTESKSCHLGHCLFMMSDGDASQFKWYTPEQWNCLEEQVQNVTDFSVNYLCFT